jgi:serine/threonine-protein kinase
VWAARNLDLDMPVALELMRGENGDARMTAERLFREARSAARLGHPAIVRVFDLGEDPDGSPFIVMERPSGETLAERLIRTGRLSPELSARIRIYRGTSPVSRVILQAILRAPPATIA